MILSSAEVVELVDALRSGRSVLRDVGVRIPPSAPRKTLFYKGLRAHAREPLFRVQVTATAKSVHP